MSFSDPSPKKVLNKQQLDLALRLQKLPDAQPRGAVLKVADAALLPPQRENLLIVILQERQQQQLHLRIFHSQLAEKEPLCLFYVHIQLSEQLNKHVDVFKIMRLPDAQLLRYAVVN